MSDTVSSTGPVRVSAMGIARSVSALPVAVSPRPVPNGADLDHPSLYFNRELGWLDFNWRVLAQCSDPRIPLLERVRFLAIACSNLDEFFQKRVGGLKRQQAAGVLFLSYDGRDPSEQLSLIRTAAGEMTSWIDRVWIDEMVPLLANDAGVRIVDPRNLNRNQATYIREYFRDHLYPLLTPLAVDRGHPFPFVSNLSLSLAILLRHPSRTNEQFVRLKVPTRRGRWVEAPSSGPHRVFVPLERVIAHHVAELFPGMRVTGVHAFRVTRNADVRRDEEEAEDLLAYISEELRERRFAPVVRLEIDPATPESVRTLLAVEFGLRAEDLYAIRAPLALHEAMELANLDIPEHRFTPWEPIVPAVLLPRKGTQPDIFSTIRRGDILVHHPYDSFAGSVQRLVEEAAVDPDVVAIKQTLYRTSDDSPVLRALLRAAANGKHVAVLVEVKARFDEANNIEWGQMLETAGVHVTYGLVGLKTHAKITLIVRNEGGKPQTYCHIGTGNYHAGTARVYADAGLLTCDPEIGRDIVNLFHSLSGSAPDQHYEHLLVSPRSMRSAFEQLIRGEVEIREKGGTGRIVAKMNALDDPGIIRELYRASQAGVRIDLIVRGHTRLRPGIAGVSEHIRIVSIIGRFLEHDRIFLFGNGGDPKVFIGSADWRQRNLMARVEVVVPIRDPASRQSVARLLDLALLDNRLGWDLEADGRWRRRSPAAGEEERSYQEILMAEALKSGGGGEPAVSVQT